MKIIFNGENLPILQYVHFAVYLPPIPSVLVLQAIPIFPFKLKKFFLHLLLNTFPAQCSLTI